jgi:hypothetical protein
VKVNPQGSTPPVPFASTILDRSETCPIIEWLESAELAHPTICKGAVLHLYWRGKTGLETNEYAPRNSPLKAELQRSNIVHAQLNPVRPWILAHMQELTNFTRVFPW